MLHLAAATASDLLPPLPRRRPPSDRPDTQRPIHVDLVDNATVVVVAARALPRRRRLEAQSEGPKVVLR